MAEIGFGEFGAFQRGQRDAATRLAEGGEGTRHAGMLDLGSVLIGPVGWVAKWLT